MYRWGGTVYRVIEESLKILKQLLGKVNGNLIKLLEAKRLFYYFFNLRLFTKDTAVQHLIYRELEVTSDECIKKVNAPGQGGRKKEYRGYLKSRCPRASDVSAVLNVCHQNYGCSLTPAIGSSMHISQQTQILSLTLLYDFIGTASFIISKRPLSANGISANVTGLAFSLK